jgi:hypothetical protein
LLRSWILVLNQDRDDPGRIVVEVYDHAEPPIGVQDVLPVEALAAGARVVLAMVRHLDGGEDRVDVLEQPGPAPLREVEVRPGIEDDHTPAARTSTQ